jgi:hypothetical protein
MMSAGGEHYAGGAELMRVKASWSFEPQKSELFFFGASELFIFTNDDLMSTDPETQLQKPEASSWQLLPSVCECV